MNNIYTKDFILNALHAIPCTDVTTRDWLRVGMALQNEGFGVNTWDEWSATDPERYTPGECVRRWNTFTPGMGTGGATITYLAKQFGWVPDNIQRRLDLKRLCSVDVRPRTGVEALLEGPRKDPVQELTEYIEAVFNDDDTVPIITNAYLSTKGKWMPGTANFTDMEKLLDDIATYDSLQQVIGRYNRAAGAWIGINPFDGDGQRKDNVTEYKHVLIECDDIPVQEQLHKYLELRIPIVALVHSGNRSLHAVVHIDATDYEQYKKRVSFMFKYLKGAGLPIDEECKNPNRWCRLPGAVRNTSRQWLIGTDFGASSYEDWIYDIAGLE